MSSAVREASIGADPVHVHRLLHQVTNPEDAGIGLFIAAVRDNDGSEAVTSLDYTAHPSAPAVLAACAERAAAAHDVLTVAVEHRVGHLEVGDLAVVVAVGAVHRAEALAACRQLIDDLKAEVPIWKEQAFGSGAVAWVGLPEPEPT